MITITYITQLIFSGQDMHTRGSTTQCLSVVMWQYFSFRTITQLANKNQYFGNNLSILIFRKLLIPNLYLYWEWVNYVKLCALFWIHWWIQTGVTVRECSIRVKINDFFVPCDLKIWWMILENYRAPLLCHIKFCASFQSHVWI